MATIVSAFGALLLVVVAGMAFFVFRRSPRRSHAFISEPKAARINMHPEVVSSLWVLLAALLIIVGLLYAMLDRDFLLLVPTAKFWAPAAGIAGIFFIYRFGGAAGKYFGALVVGFLVLFIVVVGAKSVQSARQTAEQVRRDSAAAAIARQYTLDSLRIAQQNQSISAAEPPTTPTPQSTPDADVGVAEYARRISDERERIAKDSAKAAALVKARLDLNMGVANASLNGWEAPADLQRDLLKQPVTLVCTPKGIALAAQLAKRLGALGAIVSYEVRDILDAPNGGQLRYSSANYRASTAIQAALIDLIRLDLVNQPGLSQVVLLLNVEQ